MAGANDAWEEHHRGVRPRRIGMLRRAPAWFAPQCQGLPESLKIVEQDEVTLTHDLNGS
jgi:hypothetical protein